MIAIQVILFLIALGLTTFNVFKSFKRNKDNEISGISIPRVGIGLLLFITFLLAILPSFGQVPAGNRGVVLQFGAVTGQVYDEGLYWVMPFVQSVELMDVQTHADKASATAASHDLQDVATEVTVNYRLDPSRVAWVYQNLRHDYVTRIMQPAVQEAIKSATAQFDAERLVVERPRVKDTIEQYVTKRLAQHGMIVDGITITDFKFSPAFSEAIEAKVTATQQALKAKNDLARIEMEAQQRVATAKAEAEAIRIQAQAITSQGGRDYVALKAIEKWNGTVPQWTSGGNAIPFINLGDLSKER